jgi:3(or 17)beta-hydroxysteroid dehydrogenase
MEATIEAAASNNPPSFAMRSSIRRAGYCTWTQAAMVSSMSGELSGQVAIVTGGASGIGAASAALLADAGATVVIADLQDSGTGSGRFLQHDVTIEESWQALRADVLECEGRLDIMVNNAGISGGAGNIETTDVGTWQRVQAVNSDGVFLGCKYAIQGMKHTSADKPASRGSIVNLSSVAGLISGSGSLAYTASKGAVRLLSKSVALYCAERQYGIRCNSVHPGGVDTPIFDGFWQIVGHDQGKALLGSRHPIGRMAEPDEIGEVVLWLASDRSSFVTGAEIAADGGLSAGLMRRQPFVAR